MTVSRVRSRVVLPVLSVLLGLASALRAADVASSAFNAAQQTAVDAIDADAADIAAVNRAIWEFAEIGLEETQSSELLISRLRQNGFRIRRNIADMPTAFVASYGSGAPVIGILAEYDALPGLSQKVSPVREPLVDGAAGHGCGHCGLGSGALGAACAVRKSIERHKLGGTIRLYGTPAEETVVGKVYMVLDDEFRDLDVCLHWHPATKTEAWFGSSKALVSAKFSFHGIAAHASGSPEKGRSALDAVELMNIGVNFAREHVREDARFHYVVTNGGGAPNVVPAAATAWYFVRADRHDDAERYFKRVRDIARGAALMTRTSVNVRIETDCHELIPNTPLSELMHRNLTAVGPPKFTDSERAFARRLQQALIDEFGKEFPNAIDSRIRSLSESTKTSKGSTDVGDISWFVPTGGIRTTCLPAESPGHSWQNVACIASPIGEKGIIYAAKVLAVSAIELLQHPKLIDAARQDWQQRMSGRKYTTLIPEGQPVPARIR